MNLFGIGKSRDGKDSAQTSSGPIFDADTTRFETQVLKTSMERPVLVDFWAPWCGPCKQLMPLLEAEVMAAKGEVLLAKVNIDENPQLAQALRIQSVPTVMAFFQGQPVTAFTGARPQSEIKNLVGQLIKLARSAKPDAIDIPAALKQAAAEPNMAHELYIRILQQDENNIEAYSGLVRWMIGMDRLEEAESMILHAPDALAKNPALEGVKTALDLAREGRKAATLLKPLLQKVDAAPQDHQSRFDLARAQFASGEKAAAIDNLLNIMEKDRSWNDDAARKELLRFFDALGFADPLSIEGRKKLSRLLFS